MAKNPLKTNMEMSSRKTQLPQVSRVKISESHTARAVCLKDSGGGTDSRKNLKKPNIYISTFNVRSLSTEDRVAELESELQGIHWSVVGLSEVRRCGEACVTLKSGHILFYKGNDTTKINGVGFLIHKNIANRVTQYHSISERVTSINIKINTRYTCKIIQVYAPTTEHEEEEIEQFYEDINKALRCYPAHYVFVVGDFNSKIGRRQDQKERGLGPFGLGERNDRGQTLIDYTEENNLYIMNTYFKKKESRRWTWQSPDGKTKNEIDYIITNNRTTVLNTEVINTVNAGSDHRMIRARVQFNTKLERTKLVRPKQKSIDIKVLHARRPEYENKLRRVGTLEENLDELNKQITQHIKKSAQETATKIKGKQSKLSQGTVDLIQRRKTLMQEPGSRNNTQVKELNGIIRKRARSDIRNYNCKQIEETLEGGKSLKKTRMELSEGRSHIIKLKKPNNEIATQKDELRQVAEEFYRSLYKSKIDPPQGKNDIKQVRIQNVGSEDIPDITKEEILHSLKKMSKGRAPGEDGLIAEFLQYGGETVLQMLEKLYNKCLQQHDIPQDWDNALMILLFKKGDHTDLGNYRPISLLSILYKLFTKIVTERLTTKMDSYQSREQAGFRKGYSTLDHLQAVRTLIERANEYNINLWMMFVDYEKAFDSVETWAVLDSLNNCRIDHRYTSLIQNIYGRATVQVVLQEKTDKIKIDRGVRQGDTISPKLFTLALEDMFRKLKWEKKGINVEGEYLSHLRFADDIVVIANSREEMQEMITELNVKSKEIGLKMNIAKTKYMTNEKLPENITIQVDDMDITKTDSYIYLGQKITAQKDNLRAELPRRISLAWSAFGKLKNTLTSDLPNTLKAKVFDTYILPVFTYGSETWSINNEIMKKVRTAQRAMERRMLGINLRDRFTKEEIRRRSKVTDVTERLCRQRWNWAGHLARLQDNRWTRRLVEWRPWAEKRSRGRPQTRWHDDIRRLVGHEWMRLAQDRERWKSEGEAYIRRWMI